MTFAVGLREDAANAEYYVKKILPMSFYEPGKPVEKRARAPPKDAPPVEALDVPELVEMRQRLRDVLRGCEKMEREEKQCAAELQAATDRLATVEKRSAQLDDQLDQYDEQLAEERNRTLAASMDAEQTRAQHAELLEQVERGERAVARLERCAIDHFLCGACNAAKHQEHHGGAASVHHMNGNAYQHSLRPSRGSHMLPK